MRNTARGNIVGVVSSNSSFTVRAMMGRGAIIEQHNGLIGSLVDDNNGVSMPMKFPRVADPLEAMTRYREHIDQCESPYTEIRGVFRKHEYVTGCRALGDVAIRDEGVINLMLNAAATELK
jgi:hypothetical protein